MTFISFLLGVNNGYLSKYLVIWERDRSSWPIEHEERIALRVKMVEMTKQDIKEGRVSDWGVFVGGGAGYAVCEGNKVEVYKAVHRYLPYYNFEVKEVLTMDEVTEVLKSQTK